MKKKNLIILVIIIIFLIVGGICYYFFFQPKNNDKNSYDATKTQQINLKNGNTSNTEEINNTSSGENNNTPENTSSSSTPVEKTLATFSTKIYSKDSARQNNIKITCNSLNNTTVKNGSTFSFCNTVGQATSAKGYQKADIFDKDGNKKKGLGRR